MTDITLYYNPTPNGHKPLLLLEELGANYEIRHVDIERGDQFEPWFDDISPNNRIPAIVDHRPADSGDPLPVFESGAILHYLADKYGRYLPTGRRARTQVMEWLFWQVGGLGPMAGQAHHFLHYAPERVDYARERYGDECTRLYSVMDRRLAGRDYLAGAYSIADMASWGWVMRHERHGQNLDDFPELARWYAAIESRPAVGRVREIAARYRGVSASVSDRSRDILFTPRKKSKS
ncbi:MAG: glutathione S-transferase [Proteobacteria bacterium]|nr:MAG: glutathione S-transferase [Pseudomonadota bacterium]